MKIIKPALAFMLIAASTFASAADILNSKSTIKVYDNQVAVKIDFVLDSLNLKPNQQLYVSPVLEDGSGNRVVLPAILVNGRNMHYAWQRGTIKRGGEHNYVVAQELRRLNGKQQHIEYSHTVPYAKWMRSPSAHLVLVGDSCGCGHEYGSRMGGNEFLGLTPTVRAVYKTPEVTELPVTIHEGRARVQFEVDRTELHDSPYTCRNGQRIDNREQLKVIDDSVRYALSNPNVEISSIKVVGYASPESPYVHNEQLSTGRSRALAEYLGRKYNLPADKAIYDAVAENWGEFREFVEKSDRFTPDQRRELLELIDEPAYGPADYDRKERTLKNDKRFASLYRSYILPEIFPKLRATEFEISTRLKPMSDPQLAEVIRKTPELMTLNQMMRVARLYDEGSDDFNEVIDIALKHYPNDPTAKLNAAVAAINKGDLDKASMLLEGAGTTPEAENARGVIEVEKGNYDKAAEHFKNAATLPEARENLKALEL